MTARRRPAADQTQGRFAYDGLDRAIHEKARLGILSSLATHRGGLSFNDLKELCALTDGNLSRHLAVLCDESLVKVEKSTHRRRPLTVYTITAEGRRRFLDYINVLEQVVADAIAVRRTAPAPRWKPGVSKA